MKVTHWIFFQMKSRKAFAISSIFITTFFLWKIPQNCFFSLIITFKCIVFLAMTQRPKEDDRHFHHPLWPIFMILRKLAMLSKLTIDVSLHQNKLRKFWWKLKEWEHCLYSIFLGHFLVKNLPNYAVYSLAPFFVTLIALRLLVPTSFKSVPRGRTFLF